MRKDILLSDNWLFHRGDLKVDFPKDKGPVYFQSKTERKRVGPASYYYFDRPDPFANEGELRNEGWYPVNIPHDYIIDQDIDRNYNNALGYLKYENAWYRKHFQLDEEEIRGKRVYLYFEGIAGQATIYLNGCLMKHNFSKYNSFQVDISDNIYYDKENIIAVYVNCEEFEGWWYQGSGIYRNVHLVITEPVAIDIDGVYAPYKKIDDNNWQIDFETTVVNTSYEDCKVEVESKLIDKNGKVILSAIGCGEIKLRDKNVINYSAKIENPYLWSPEEPNLYTIETVLKMNEEEIDVNSIRIGFRTVEISKDKELLINGKKTYINGVCCHQDFGLTGLALTDNVAKYKIKLIKEMGANGYRTSHYQHSAATMDALDELGFIVMDEARWFETTDEALEQLRSLVKRDRNRPSVVFWSTSNEEPSHVNDMGKRIHKAIYTEIRKLDKSRFIMAAEDQRPDKSTIYDDCDVVGINYNLHLYDVVEELCPDKAVFASECCATGTSRDWNFSDNLNGKMVDYDKDANDWFRGREYTWRFLKSRPYVIGCYQWIAIDHRGEAAWPAISSKSGAMDMFLQKKSAFYLNKAYWTKEPMVHIVPHWNFKGLEGQNIKVTVYTNCDELHLYLNDKLIGKQEIEEFGRGLWDVPYEAGTLRVEGYRDGKLVCEDSRTTTKKAHKLTLKLDNEFEANGTDLAIFTCECVDEDGRYVPDASEFVKFSVAAPAKIVGTGSDNCDHNNITLPERKMYMGKITVAVRPQKDQKKLELMAYSDNCGYCRLVIDL